MVATRARVAIFIVGFFGFLHAYPYENSDWILGSNDVAYSNPTFDLYDALFRNAKYVGGVGAFYQQNFGDDGTFGEMNIRGGYESDRLYGVLIGAGAIFTGKLYANPQIIFDESREIFLLNSLYANYKIPYLEITAGRYKAYEEWNNYYNQGLSVIYDGYENLSLHFLASYGSAIVRNDFLTEFRRDLLNIYTLYGSYLFSAIYNLPDTNAKFKPYAYINSYFTALGLKATLDFHLIYDMETQSSAHLVGYLKYYPHIVSNLNANNEHILNEKFYETLHNSNNSHSAIAWLEQSLKWHHFEGKAGIIGVTGGGAEFIDYYGQSTPFEYTSGIFYPNAFSMYLAFEMELEHILHAHAAVRETFLPSGNAFGMEIGGEGFLTRRIKIGANVSSLYSSAPIINFYGGSNYTIVRGFIQYLF